MRKWLRSIREIKCMSEKQVATLVGISQPAYHMIETNQKNPSVPTAQKIAKVLGFDWTLFFPSQIFKTETLKEGSISHDPTGQPRAAGPGIALHGGRSD